MMSLEAMPVIKFRGSRVNRLNWHPRPSSGHQEIPMLVTNGPQIVMVTWSGVEA